MLFLIALLSASLITIKGLAASTSIVVAVRDLVVESCRDFLLVAVGLQEALSFCFKATGSEGTISEPGLGARGIGSTISCCSWSLGC